MALLVALAASLPSTVLAVVPCRPGAASPERPARPHATAALDLATRSLAALAVGRDPSTIRTLRAEATSVDYDVVENDHDGPPFPLIGTSRTVEVEDYVNGTKVVEAAPSNAGQSPASRTVYSCRAVSTLAGDGPAATRFDRAPSPDWDLQDPIRTLRLAIEAPDLRIEPDEQRHGFVQHVLSFSDHDRPIRVLIDALLGLPTAVETVEHHSRPDSADVAWTGWGDVRERTEFLNWQLDEGLRYPQQIDVFRNDAHVRTTVRSRIVTNASSDAAMLDRIAPAAATSFADLDDLRLGQTIGRSPAPELPVSEIAPGVVQIPGSWYSTIVRQPDGLVIIDAPISAAYSKLVLAEAARRFPGSKVKALITSTSFFWHIAGIREYAARGIPIYLRDKNVSIVRAQLAAKSTIRPDDLARHPRRPILRPVSRPLRVGTGINAVVVMPIRYGEQPMVMTWIPDAEILDTAEMVQPLGPGGSLILPEALYEVTRSVEEAGIPTARLRIIGMHMSPKPWSAVGAALRPALVVRDDRTPS